MAQLSVGADAEEKTPSGLQENSIKERRPCPETNIPQILVQGAVIPALR